MQKAELRQRFRALRDGLGAEARARASAAATAHLLARLPRSCRAIGLYATFGSELDTAGLFASLRARDITVCYPRCAARQLLFVPVRALAELAPGSYRIPEPAGAPVPLAELDVVVVPGLAFDRRGGRLGYGGGYYDRTLEGARACLFGLAFAQQLVDELPRDGHDLAVDVIVTDAGVVETIREGRCPP